MRVFLIFLIATVIWSCTETIEKPIGIKGDLVASLETFDEFGRLDGEYVENSRMELFGQGNDSLYIFDEIGQIVISDLDMGMYQLVFSKAGFLSTLDTITLAVYDSIWIYGRLFQATTVRIINNQLSVDGSNLIISGDMTNNWPSDLFVKEPNFTQRFYLFFYKEGEFDSDEILSNRYTAINIGNQLSSSFDQFKIEVSLNQILWQQYGRYDMVVIPINSFNQWDEKLVYPVYSFEYKN